MRGQWGPSKSKAGFYLNLFSPFLFFPPETRDWILQSTSQTSMWGERDSVTSQTRGRGAVLLPVVCLWLWEQLSSACLGIVPFGSHCGHILHPPAAGMKVKLAHSISAGSFPPWLVPLLKPLC